TAIATAGMRALPIGFPKVMVSTLASGNTAQYVGVKDIVMFPSVADVAGLNRLSRQILTRAAGAICGMVEIGLPASGPPNALIDSSAAADRPLIVASQFGNTTTCVEQARKVLEAAGYEVMVFAATGTGGRTMESIIESGLVAGVLDITTTEWADELVGGVLNAGPTRLEAAARHGVPAIVTPGCLDMVNFGQKETVPARFAGRNFYQHNPQVTLMRTTPDECRELGRIIAEKLNLSTGPVTLMLPKRAISVISAPGQKFHDPAADEALFSALKEGLRADIEVIEMDCGINDLVFAQACANALLKNIAMRNAVLH
ncbi:MAG: Tm-1-like ATP-binding domain-containing protein, partial [Opitutaceae bacterium]|nr:Tm-1-like ATP-binding domain-containing protein [Verrucomicrobiales bacterium]